MNKIELAQWVRPEILSQPPYRVKTRSYAIKLNQNESPWDWPEDIKQLIAKRIADAPWNLYPELIPDRLKQTLGKSLGVKPGNIIFGKGSNEILQALFKVALRPGDTMCTLSPTFAVYQLLAEQQSVRVLTSQLDSNFYFDNKDLLNKSATTQLTILCNPNSPTGTIIPINVIKVIAKQCRGLVIIDEAYVDFSSITGINLIKDFPNVVVLRTFSKAFALAGFRVGYAIMARDLGQEVQKGLLPFNMDMPSVIAAEVLISHEELVQQRVSKLISEREKVISHLNSLKGIIAWPSKSNFFLLETPLGAAGTFDFLAQKGILVRDVSTYPGCEHLVRVTVGAPRDNQALIDALEELI